MPAKTQTAKKRTTKSDQKNYLIASAADNIEAQEDFRRFLDMSNDVMIVTGSNGEFIRVNDTFYNVFGYDEKDLAKINFFDLFESKPHIGNTENFEARMRTKDGAIRWMQWHQKLRGDQLYCVGRDLTDIKKHEAALTRRQKQLTEAESIGRMGHWRWQIGQDDIEWSEEIFRIFGEGQKSFAPSIHKLTDRVHKRDVGRVIQAFQRAIIEEKDYDMEFRITATNGETRYIRCEGRCEKDYSGEVVALYGIMQDMTERMLYEQELQDAKNSSERAYAAKSQFLANMSHELRTPLNAILGFSEMMQKQMLGPLGNEKYVGYVGGIHESGEHLLDLISDILDMSRIEAGKYDLDLEEIKVVKVIETACHMVQVRADEANIKVLTDSLKNKKLKIVADRRAVTQILLNLLSNAVKFTNDGGAVSIECHEREDFISIRVIDNGIGIPPNKLASITRPFEQVSLSYARDHNGSGLGLAITKELVELHGGTLLIDSELGKGTTATVRLPYETKQK